jgi:hypothetical protein
MKMTMPPLEFHKINRPLLLNSKRRRKTRRKFVRKNKEKKIAKNESEEDNLPPVQKISAGDRRMQLLV